ncbi:MAG: family 10 glycosylhydrolase [Planctomycetia bacterium]|nr:family 10 glycosylhydrolase [Planctomycetia bacterium]
MYRRIGMITLFVFAMFMAMPLVQLIADDSVTALTDTDLFYPLLADNQGPSLIDFASISQKECDHGVLDVPFASQKKDRAMFDCDLTIDATKVDYFYFDVETSDVKAVLGVPTLYLRSGKGWFVLRSQITALGAPGKFRMTFDVAKRTLSMYKPGPLNTISGIRLSFNRHCEIDFKLKLLSLRSVRLNGEKDKLVLQAADVWKKLFFIGYNPDVPFDAFRKSQSEKIVPLLKQHGYSPSEVITILKNRGTLEQTQQFTKVLKTVCGELETAYAQSIPSRKIEARLWWESNGTGIFPGDWDQTMKLLSDNGFNGIIPIMLWGGSALYPSKYLPKHPLCEQYGDQMEAACRAAKKYHVQLHPRRICFKLLGSSKEFIAEMQKANRTQKDINGKDVAGMCPSLPENRELEVNLMLELATRYSVDGIHYDFIRYGMSDVCFCPRCQQQFRDLYYKQTGTKLDDVAATVRKNSDVRKAYNAWRVELITSVVREVRRRVDQECPHVKISAAVFNSYPDCIDSVGQDWVDWIKKGYLDFVCPMNYSNDPAVFKSMCTRQQKYIADPSFPFYPGIGLNADGSTQLPSDSIVQIEMARQLGAKGFCMFNLTPKTAEAMPLFSQGVTKTKSEFPQVGKTKR